MTLNTEYTVQGLEKGKFYKFRYRAINIVGPSSWSPESSLIPAIASATPPQPIYISSTAQQIVLGLSRSPNDGGVQILNYELWIDGGSLDSSFTNCTAYSYIATGFIFTVEATVNSL